MISRVADHCFWFGRYLERAESTARVLRITQHLALDGELPARQCWLPVIIVSGEQVAFAHKCGDDAADDGERVQRYMTWDEDNITSIKRSIDALRWNARSIREVLSLEAWEPVNDLYLWLDSDEAKAQFERDRDLFYRTVRREVQLCLGVLPSTMLHDSPLDFIWLGLLLERVGQTARIVDVNYHALGTATSTRHQVSEMSLWLSLLRACSGFEPFMKRNPGRVSGQAVARFLLFEPQFPRSIRHSLHAAFKRLSQIRPPDSRELPGGQTLERLRTLDEWLVEHEHHPMDPDEIHRMLTHCVDEVAAICTGIGRELFGYEASVASEEASP